MTVHPLDLICVNVGGRHLYRRRKINNDLLLRSRSPCILYCRTDIKCEIKFCSGKAFRRIFEDNLSVEPIHVLLYHLGAFYGNFLDFLFALVKYHIPLQSGGGVINMYNRLLNSLNSLKCSLNQMLTALNQNLNYHIIRNQFPFYELS